MAEIRYVGAKPRKEDNVAGTGLVWLKGQVHVVDDPVKSAQLLAHPKIWAPAAAKYTEAQPCVQNAGGEWDEVAELKAQLGQANAKIIQMTGIVKMTSDRSAEADRELARLRAENETLRLDLDIAETELEKLKGAASQAPSTQTAPAPEAGSAVEHVQADDKQPESKVELDINDIRAALTAKGVDYPKTANKATLLKILEGN